MSLGNYMIFRKSLFAATLSLACSAPVVAAPVNVDFAFGSASGTFYDLNDDEGISEASFFDFKGTEDVYRGLSTASATCNEFTFDAAGLTDVCFSIELNQKGDNETGALTSFLIMMNSNGLFTGMSSELSSSRVAITAEPSVNFAVVPVPLPAGSLLLLTGIAAVGGLRLRKKWAAQV